MLKVKLRPSGVMAASDGLLVAKELGLLERHPTYMASCRLGWAYRQVAVH